MFDAKTRILSKKRFDFALLCLYINCKNLIKEKRAAPEDAARVFLGITALISRDTIS